MTLVVKFVGISLSVDCAFAGEILEVRRIAPVAMKLKKIPTENRKFS
jgi:hypothetical protein